MKFFFLTVLVSGIVSAQSVATPRITKIRNAVTVEIVNQNDFNITCTGMIYLHTVQGFTDMSYYYQRILNATTGEKTISLHRLNDNVQNTSHTISCAPSN